MLLDGRGEEHIRATHAKTFEFARDEAISERATCVIAVGVHGGTRIAGPVSISISAGDEHVTVDARASSAWDPAGPAVVRLGPLQLPGTLATRASAAAADLPRELVAALQRAGTPVGIRVTTRPSAPCVVLFAAAPGVADPRLAAELAAADVVVAQDAGARALTGRNDRAPEPVVGRVLVVATDGVPGRGVRIGDAEVETVGLPPALAAAVAAPWPGPTTFADGSELAEVLRRTPLGHRVVVDVDRRGVQRVLELGTQVRGSTQAVIARALAQPVRVRIADPADPVDLAGSDRVSICLAPGAAGGLDAAADDAVELLLADGVSTKTTARALAAFTGRAQRDAYAAVLASRERRGAGRPPR